MLRKSTSHHILIENNRFPWFESKITPFTAVTCIVMLFCYRFWIISLGQTNFHFDEAQYWLWAQNLQWGYFSKPPVIAWGIAAQQWLFGEHVVALRSLALAVYAIIGVAIHHIAKIAYSQTVASYAVLILVTMPAVSVSSVMITTDVFLILFWTLSLWMVFQAFQKDHMRYWFVAGVFAGMGLLSKYTMIVILPSTLMCAFLGQRPINRRVYIGIGMAACIGFLIWMPNLWWNYTHDMASFKHLYEISQLEKQSPSFSGVITFWLEQVFVFGPVSFWVLMRYCVLNKSQWVEDKHTTIWLSFFIVFFTAISLQAFGSRAFANWAAPCYISAAIWLSATMVKQGKILFLNLAILVNLLIMGCMYHYETIYKLLDVPLTASIDPMKKLRGWDTLGQKVSVVLSKNPGSQLMAENRKMITELIYYVNPHPWNAVLFNPDGHVSNHFHLNQSMQNIIGKDFIWVSASPSIDIQKQHCEHTMLIQEIKIPIYQHSYQQYYIFQCKAYKENADR